MRWAGQDLRGNEADSSATFVKLSLAVQIGRQAEVNNFDLVLMKGPVAVLEQKVIGLDIAMDDALPL